MEENEILKEVSESFKIPKEILLKQPGIPEQYKCFYNSEEWKNVAETLSRIYKTIKEAITPVVETATKAAREIHRWLMIAFSTDPEIKRCYGIYKSNRKRFGTYI